MWLNLGSLTTARKREFEWKCPQRSTRGICLGYVQIKCPTVGYPVTFVYYHTDLDCFVHCIRHTVVHETFGTNGSDLAVNRPALALNVWSTSGPLLVIAADLTDQSLESCTDCSQPHSPYRSKSQLYAFMPTRHATATAIIAWQQTYKITYSFIVIWYSKIINKQFLWTQVQSSTRPAE